jgi:hypothetical protein
MFDVLLRVNIVQNGVRITLISSSEDNNVIESTHIFYDFLGVGTHTNVATDNFIMYCLEGHFNLVILNFEIMSMNESFIHIKHYCLPI